MIVAVLATVLSAFSLSALAAGKRSGDFEYTVKNGKATITKCYSKDCKIKIPDKLNGYEVICIGKDAKTLDPVAPASRADVAMMLMRMWMKGMFF